MAFADTSAATMAYAPEVTYGVNPVAGSKYLRFTSDSLNQTTATTVSEEIGASRSPRETVRTSISAEGDVNFEFSENTFEDLFEGALGGDFSTPIALTARSINISGVAAGQFTLTDTGGTAFTDAVEGQWLRLQDFDVNGTIYARIVTKTSNGVVVAQGTRSDGVAVTNESGNADIDVHGSHLKLGTTKKSFTIQRAWTDISLFDLFTGMVVGGASITISPEEIINGSFSFQGVKQEEFLTNQMGTIQAAGSESVANAIDNIEGIFEGVFTEESPLCITELTINIDNQLRTRLCIGNFGAVDVGLGTANITGSLTAFLENETQLEKYLNFEDSKLSFRLTDEEGRVTIFTFPAIKFTSGQNVISGNAADGLVELEWAAGVEGGISNSAMTIDTVPNPTGS